MLTGASGLIGSEVRRLAPPSWDVVTVGRPAVDLAEPGFAARLPARVDCVLHLAQARRYRDFPASAPEVVAVNASATAALLHHALAAGATRFVLASSATVYVPSHAPLAEDAPVRVRSMYAASKRSAELLAVPYAGLLDVRVLRIFTAFGAVRDDRLVADLVERVRTGRPVQVQGERGLVVSPLPASDVARAAIAAVERPVEGDGPDTVNVGGRPLGIVDIAEAIGRVVDRSPAYERRPGPDPPGFACDRTKAERVLGLGPPEDLDEALGRALR